MVEIETKATHDYLAVLERLGRPSPPIDEQLEHILITGMFHAFFELIIHEMPLEKAKHYLKEMRAFYTAGWLNVVADRFCAKMSPFVKQRYHNFIEHDRLKQNQVNKLQMMSENFGI